MCLKPNSYEEYLMLQLANPSTSISRLLYRANDSRIDWTGVDYAIWVTCNAHWLLDMIDDATSFTREYGGRLFTTLHLVDGACLAFNAPFQEMDMFLKMVTEFKPKVKRYGFC